MPALQRSVQMANSYTIAPPIEKIRSAAQQEFLLNNHHCISPWMYTPHQIRARNHALFLQEFDRAQNVNRVATYLVD